jgi:hypothetical protein
MTKAQFAIVVDAEGHYGDTTTVWFAGTAEACEKFAQRSRNVQVVYGVEGMQKGDKITRGGLIVLKAVA